MYFSPFQKQPEPNLVVDLNSLNIFGEQFLPVDSLFARAQIKMWSGS